MVPHARLTELYPTPPQVVQGSGSLHLPKQCVHTPGGTGGLALKFRRLMIIGPFRYREGNFLSFPQYNPVWGWSQIARANAYQERTLAIVTRQFHETSLPLRLPVPVARVRSAARLDHAATVRET